MGEVKLTPDRKQFIVDGSPCLLEILDTGESLDHSSD